MKARSNNMNNAYPGYMNPAKKNSILRFTPPGFKYALDIPFPGRVLPVCARCKKNYKTREHCRTKEQHHTLPWTDTYICLTFDSSCFGPDGGLRLEEGPFTAHGVPSQPYIYPEEIDLDPKTPSCAQCKDKNYTRTYCRTNKKHRTLPWSTVYAVLSGPPQGGNYGEQGAGTGEGPMIAPTSSNDDDSLPKKKLKTDQGVAVKAEVDKNGSDDAMPKLEEKNNTTAAGEGDDKEDGETSPGAKDKEQKNEVKEELKDAEEVDDKDTKAMEAIKKENDFVDIFKNPHPSKTFLATVSLTKNEVRWVDMDQAQAALMHHRSSKGQGVDFDVQDGLHHMHHHSQMPYQMMHPSSMHPMALHPSFGHLPGLPPPYFGYGQGQHHMPGNGGMKMEPGGGMDGGRTGGGNQMDGLQQQNWMNQNDPSGGMQFPTPDMMYQAQMMDPRAAAMAGYGYQPWNQQQQHSGGGGRGGGYSMDMGGMSGGPAGGHMPYDGHMMQQMGWGNPQSQHQGNQGPGQGDMGGMPQSMSPHGPHGGMHGGHPMSGMPLMPGMGGHHQKDMHHLSQQPYSPQRMHDSMQVQDDGSGSRMRNMVGNGHTDIQDESKHSEENVSI